MESEILRLEKELKHGRYQPGGYKTFKIYELKERIIMTSPYTDRVVHLEQNDSYYDKIINLSSRDIIPEGRLVS